eukprot:g498.t1
MSKDQLLRVTFTNQGYFKAKCIITYNIFTGTRKGEIVKLKHGEHIKIPRKATSIRLRIKVKKGVNVFVGGYQFLNDQYDIPDGASGDIEFIVSGTVHFEQIEIKRHDNFLGKTVSNKKTRAEGAHLQECVKALRTFHRVIARGLTDDQSKWDKEEKPHIVERIAALRKKRDTLRAQLDELASASLTSDSEASHDDEATTLDSPILRIPRHTTTEAQITVARELAHGSVHLSKAASLVKKLESSLLRVQCCLDELERKIHFGIMADPSRRLNYFDHCGGSSGVFFAFRSFHVDEVDISFDVRAYLRSRDKLPPVPCVVVSLSSCQLSAACSAFRVVAESGSGVPNMVGDNTTIGINLLLHATLEYVDTNCMNGSGSDAVASKRPCSECASAFDSYSRLCVDCGVSLCREHKKAFMKKIERRRWRCVDQEQCAKRRSRVKANSMKEWRVSDPDFAVDVKELDLSGLHVGVPVALVQWVAKAYIPTTIREALLNMLPNELGAYLQIASSSNAGSKTKDLFRFQGHVSVRGPPHAVLTQTFKLGSTLSASEHAVSDSSDTLASSPYLPSSPDGLRRSALKFLGLTPAQGHLLHKLRRRIGLAPEFKRHEIWKEATKWQSLAALMRYGQLLDACCPGQARTRQRVLKWWQMTIDYYAKEDGIVSPSLLRIFSLTERLSHRPVYFSHRLTRLCGQFDVKELIQMIRDLGLRTLLNSSSRTVASQQRRAPSPSNTTHMKTKRHSVMSTLRTAQAVQYELQMDEWIEEVKKWSERFHSACLVASICLQGGKKAVFDVGGRDICVVFRPDGFKRFDRHEMPPSREAMCIFADGPALRVDYLVEGVGGGDDDENIDEESNDRSTVGRNVEDSRTVGEHAPGVYLRKSIERFASKSDHREAVDILHMFGVQGARESDQTAVVRKKKETMKPTASGTTTTTAAAATVADIVRDAYGRSRFFPQHDRLAIASLTEVSASACVVDTKKLVAHLEKNAGKGINLDLIRLRASGSSSAKTGTSSLCETSASLAPGVAVAIRLDECHLTASPYRLCEYLLKGGETRGEGEMEKEEEKEDSLSSKAAEVPHARIESVRQLKEGHYTSHDTGSICSRYSASSASLETDTATKIGMRNYAKKVWKLTKTVKNVSSTLTASTAVRKRNDVAIVDGAVKPPVKEVSSKEDVVLGNDSQTSRKNSETHDVDATFNEALRDLIELYIGEEDLAVKLTLRVEANSLANGNVFARICEADRVGDETAPIFQYRNVAFAVDLIRRTFATFRASFSLSFLWAVGKKYRAGTGDISTDTSAIHDRNVANILDAAVIGTGLSFMQRLHSDFARGGAPFQELEWIGVLLTFFGFFRSIVWPCAWEFAAENNMWSSTLHLLNPYHVAIFSSLCGVNFLKACSRERRRDDVSFDRRAILSILIAVGACLSTHLLDAAVRDVESTTDLSRNRSTLSLDMSFLSTTTSFVSVLGVLWFVERFPTILGTVTRYALVATLYGMTVAFMLRRVDSEYRQLVEIDRDVDAFANLVVSPWTDGTENLASTETGKVLMDFVECKAQIYKMLSGAKKRIYYSTFLCDFDYPLVAGGGSEVTMKNILNNLASKGVEIFVLYNPCHEYGNQSASRIREMLDPRIRLSTCQTDLGVSFIARQLQKAVYLGYHHQKYLCVDDEIAMVCGCDINGERAGWLELNCMGYYWDEIAVTLPCTKAMARWFRENFEHPHASLAPFPLVSGAAREHDMMVHLIRTAKTEIYFANQTLLCASTAVYENKIGHAIVDRIVEAVRSNTEFQCLWLSNTFFTQTQMPTWNKDDRSRGGHAYDAAVDALVTLTSFTATVHYALIL